MYKIVYNDYKMYDGVKGESDWGFIGERKEIYLYSEQFEGCFCYKVLFQERFK